MKTDRLMRGFWRRLLRLSKKTAVFFFSLFLLSLLVFYASRLAPGDPLVSYYGERAQKLSTEERLAAEARLGLDKPLHEQYVSWLSSALKGQFGISYKYKMDVRDVIRGRIGNTLLLGGVGFLLIFVGSLLLGLFCASHEDRLADRIICKGGTVISCIPEFWLSLVLILIFSVWLNWLPSSGAYAIGGPGQAADRLRHLILPMTVVVLNHLWYYAYLVRNRVLEELRADYVQFEQSRGFSKRRILYGHCLRNVLPSYLSIMALAVPHVLGGTYVIETVFSYPGLGTLAYESARYQDYNLLMLLCLLTGAVVIFCSLVAQSLGEQLDPRVRADADKTEEAAAGAGEEVAARWRHSSNG